MEEKSASYCCEVDAAKEQFPHATEIWMSAHNWPTQVLNTALGNDFWCKPNPDFSLPRRSVSLSSTNLAIKHPRPVPQSFLTFPESKTGKKKKAMLSSITFSALCLRRCLGPRVVHEVFFLANPPINADVLENQRIGTVVQDFKRSTPERPSGFVRSE